MAGFSAGSLKSPFTVTWSLRSRACVAWLRPALWGALMLVAACPEVNPPAPDGDANSGDAVDAGPWLPPPPPPEPEDDAGEPGGGNDVPVNTVTIVESVTPPAGALAGGYRVTVAGDGLTADARVFFGEREGDLVTAAGLPRAIRVRVPQGVAPGPVMVRVVTELGVGELEGGFTYFSPVTLTGIAPAEASVAGGTPVTVTGQSLTDTMVVTIGGRQVVSLDASDDGNSATFLTPPGEVGRADVVAVDSFGRSVLELAFTYHGVIALDGVVPVAVEDAGGDGGEVVELRGSGFSGRGDERAMVRIGGAPAAQDVVISDGRLRVRLPAGLTGPQDVVVQRGLETASLDDALVVLPAATGLFDVVAAVPARADVGGGTVVTLVGAGLSTVSGVTVGGIPAGELSIVDDRQITFVAPAGPAPGPAPLEVVRADTSTARLDTFTWAPMPSITAVTPASGPVQGGTAVVIEGRGLSAVTEVTFGGVAATDVIVTDDGHITVTTPAGAAGPVDVFVRGPEHVAVQRAGFVFEAPLRVLGVRPARGAMGGDTFVTVTGTGFSRGPVAVRFDDAPAFEMTVVNDSTITVRTPPHQPGIVDVNVEQGGTTATAATAFTYFDAGSLFGGTRGGPIDGAVYITAFDDVTGLPIPGLVAFVGTDGTPVASGLTNVFGQATLSGPDVVGPQTVTIMGGCVTSATFVDVNAAEMSVYLEWLCPSEPSSGPPPSIPPPATIRGRVFGFAKEFFDPGALDQSGCDLSAAQNIARLPCEIAFAEVRTTIADEFGSPMPAGGENIVLEEGGGFFIAQSRPGRLALVALAGIFDLNNDTFRLRQLGVRREVFPEFGVNLEDQDIELTIPLDETIEVSLPDAPLVVDDAQPGMSPTVTLVLPFLQFGGEGAYTFTQAVAGNRNHRIKGMPDLPGEMQTFIAGAFTTDGVGLVTSAGTVNLVAGQRFVEGRGTESAWRAPVPSQPSPVVGSIFVTTRPDDGSRFASLIIGSPTPSIIQLQDAPDFTASNQPYHIGDLRLPYSQVRQDGHGDLRGGVTIQPVLGLPMPLSPTHNGVMEDRMLRWKPANGQQPSLHVMNVYNAAQSDFEWQFFVDGARSKVVMPRVPAMDALAQALPLAQRTCLQAPTASEACGFFGNLAEFAPPADLPLGVMVWIHQTMFAPGLDFDNWSLLEIGGRGARASTASYAVFIRGAD